MHQRAFVFLSLFGVPAGILLSAARAEARGGWPDIPFVYSYEAGPGEGVFVPVDNALGCLDGEWHHSTAANSDSWDGSTPEPGDGCPGGIEIQSLPGEGDGGGDASVLSLEDVGDPRGGGAGPCPTDPSNRKFYLWRDTTSELNLATGVTLVARWRLNPEPKSLEFANNGGTLPVPNGMPLHNANKGQIGFVQKNAVAPGTKTAGLAFAITDEGHLQFAQNYNGAACAGSFFPGELCVDVDELGWVSVWMAAEEDPEVPGQIHAKVYLNGGTEPEIEFTRGDINADVESAAAADSYINIGLGNTGFDGAIQVDYVCIASGFLEPSTVNPACPGGASAALDGRDVVLSWANGNVAPTSVDISRDGVPLVDDAPADPPTYRDVTPPPGDHAYELSFSIPGQSCDPLQIAINSCPRGLAADPFTTGVRLTWQNPGSADLSLSRNGTVIANPATNDTSYLDADARGRLTYSLVPTTGTCAATEATIQYSRPPGQGDFSGITLEPSYCLDPPPSGDPALLLKHNPVANELGDLDGNWSSGNGSDSWDGSAPGVVGDPLLDVAGQEIKGAEAPGGIGLVTDGAVGAYLLEDTGDPTTRGWADPSNRKLYLGNDLGAFVDDSSTRSLISDGVTLRARFRITPAARAVDVADAPNGYHNHSGAKSIFSLVHDSGATGGLTPGSQRLAFALDMNPAEPSTGLLLIGGETDNELAIPIADPTQWLDLWVTTEDPDPQTREINLNVYLNGSATPALSVSDFLPLAGGREADIADEGGGLSRNPANLLYMGLGETGQSGSIEVDLVCVFDGALAPENPPPQGVGPFLRGDCNQDGANVGQVTDGVFLLNFIFLGGPRPICLAACDMNGDGAVPGSPTDAIYFFNFNFLGGPPTPEPLRACARSSTPGDMALGCNDPRGCQ